MVCDRRLCSTYILFRDRLNPYSIGIWSATESSLYLKVCYYGVLILILLEYGLQHLARIAATRNNIVLILILLEYGLQPGNHKQLQQ